MDDGFWGSRNERAFFDVRVFNPLAPSNSTHSIPATYKKHEREKKREYGARVREVEHGCFTPLVFSSTVQTEQGAKCKDELETVFKNVSTSANLLLGLGVCYGLKKNFAKHNFQFADVLVGKVIDMSLAPRIENGILIPRGSPREIPKRVQKIFCVNPDIMG